MLYSVGMLLKSLFQRGEGPWDDRRTRIDTVSGKRLDHSRCESTVSPASSHLASHSQSADWSGFEFAKGRNNSHPGTLQKEQFHVTGTAGNAHAGLTETYARPRFRDEVEDKAAVEASQVLYHTLV